MSEIKKIAVINGPNLDRLGKRQPEIYGRESLRDLERVVREEFESEGVALEFFQSNHEGGLIDKIAEFADSGFRGIVINPGALTHTSVALRDALAGAGVPAIEVHLSNIYSREPFRQHSLTAPACRAVISGLGFFGYGCAVRFLLAK